jgi:hypothetical protein
MPESTRIERDGKAAGWEMGVVSNVRKRVGIWVVVVPTEYRRLLK